MLKIQTQQPLPSIMITPDSPQIGSLSISSSSPIFSPYFISEFISKDVFYPPPLDISGESDDTSVSMSDDAIVPQSPSTSLFSPKSVSTSSSTNEMLRNKNACSTCNRVIQLYLVSSRSRRKCATQCISCHRMICDNCTFLKYKQQNNNTSNNSSSNNNSNSNSYLPIKRSPSPKSMAQSKRVIYCINCSQHQKKTPFTI